MPVGAGGGHPATAHATIGLDVGGTKVLAVVLEQGQVVAEQRWPTPRDGESLLALLAALVADLAGAGSGAVAVGVGLPGLVDAEGTLRFAPNLPGVVDVPVATALTQRTGLGVTAENDATCAAWAERQAGAARGSDHCVLVTLGTGIGGGVVSGGRLLRGAHGFAGEIGHMVVDPDGPCCPCGRRGCWERFASGSGLARLGRQAASEGRAARVVALAGGDPEEVRGEHVTVAALEGDAEARAVMDELAGWVAVGLVNLVNVLDAELLLLGGGLVRAGDALLEPTRRHLARRIFAPDRRPPVRIELAALGEGAGAIGAALLAAGPHPLPSRPPGAGAPPAPPPGAAGARDRTPRAGG